MEPRSHEAVSFDSLVASKLDRRMPVHASTTSAIDRPTHAAARVAGMESSSSMRSTPNSVSSLAGPILKLDRVIDHLDACPVSAGPHDHHAVPKAAHADGFPITGRRADHEPLIRADSGGERGQPGAGAIRSTSMSIVVPCHVANDSANGETERTLVPISWRKIHCGPTCVSSSELQFVEQKQTCFGIRY